MTKKDLKKLAIPFAALLAIVLKDHLGVEVTQDQISTVLDVVLAILVAFGVFTNPDKS